MGSLQWISSVMVHYVREGTLSPLPWSTTTAWWHLEVLQLVEIDCFLFLKQLWGFIIYGSWKSSLHIIQTPMH